MSGAKARCSTLFSNYIPGHVQVWCLAVSSMGDFVVTSGADRALRVWQRTEEPFFVEEEKEKRLESLFEADLEVTPLADCMSASFQRSAGTGYASS